MPNRQHKEKSVACPDCKAAIGQNCLTAPGTFGRYHAERIAASRGASYLTSERAPDEKPLTYNRKKGLMGIK